MQKHTARNVGVISLWLAVSLSHAFGPEWPSQDSYHLRLTYEAARSKGFVDSAARSLACHAEYIDKYIYDPSFMNSHCCPASDDLKHLHFDDLFTDQAVHHTWRRILHGTILALIYAARNHDVAGAQHVIGISLHAIQDFYSHSNWVDDPIRRYYTWFEYKSNEQLLRAMGLLNRFNGLWTGAYEISNRPPYVMEHGLALLPIWPFFSFGIALDKLWYSYIAAAMRGFCILEGPFLFQTALTLAQRSSEQWLTILEREMRILGLAWFWWLIQTTDTRGLAFWNYEAWNRLLFTFMSAGPYPVDSSANNAEEFFLRIRLKTGPHRFSGTDGDVFALAGGQSFLLDYNSNILCINDDFEPSLDTVYVVGPFNSPPDRVTLTHRVGTSFLNNIVQSFIEIISIIIDSIRNLIITILGGNPDFIGSAKIDFDARFLSSLPVGQRITFEKTIDGGSEGVYTIYGSLTKNRTYIANGVLWAEYRLELTRLYCNRESRWDRGSNSDEPFLLSVVAPLPGSIQGSIAGPYDDVDSGESRQINYNYIINVLNDGMISLGLALWESDDENSQYRQNMLNIMISSFNSETDSTRYSFWKTLSGWEFTEIEAYVFSRNGSILRFGPVLNRRSSWLLQMNQSVSFDLDYSQISTFSRANYLERLW